MTRPQASLVSALLLSMLLAACQPATPANGADAEAAPAAATAAGPSAEAEAAAASAAAAEGAQPVADAAVEAPSATADADTTDDAPPPPADALRPGIDYAEIQGGQPYNPLAGKIEVVEVFNYICPACAQFEPTFSAWKARQPSDVRVTYVPAPWGEQWLPYARAFYVADAMGLDAQTHEAMFRAIHIEQRLPGEGQRPDEAKVAAFYAAYGADPQRFAADMRSFGTEAKLKRGQAFIAQAKVGGTPTLIVDGKYRVLGRSYEDMLRIADALVARERAARGSATP